MESKMSNPTSDPARRRYGRAAQQPGSPIDGAYSAPTEANAVRDAPPPAPPASVADITHLLPAPAFYRIRDVLRITALSRPTLYRRIAAGRFPAPVHLGGRACAWAASSLQAWIADPDGYRSRPADEMPVRRGPGRPRKQAA
jgi:prophage regulatory protein